ncbi:hypothetical protein [Butyrivibrio sp. XBB1001]|uniref:hypothetical protein n=1 Tax=Butyrivibrio sp. XBB1001 TaxID=1280682 RepID=UPI00042A260A|nr:hypothetical protein [Butyrivibrio sp. XBB1001]
MLKRYQYRCTFKEECGADSFQQAIDKCKEKAAQAIRRGDFVNISFYRYKDMGFIYVESVAEKLVGDILTDIKDFLKTWPREDGDTYFVPMINVYYHHTPEDDLDVWEKERTTAVKTRVGRIAFVYPDKLTSYILHHKEIVDEGLLKGDKYAYISMHENLLFSYYEEPRNNVNISGLDKESEAIKRWLEVDPESHFDRVKAKGDNFLVIPCLFSVDRLDL